MSIENKPYSATGLFAGTVSGTRYVLNGDADCLPAEGTFTTEEVDFCDFKNVGILLTCGSYGTSIEGKYEKSFDASSWLDGAGTVLALDNNSQHIVPSENPIRFLRMTLVNPMANTATVKAFWFAKG